MVSDLTSADNLFRFQSEVIRKLAAEEDCIIMGLRRLRFRGHEGLVRVFIYAVWISGKNAPLKKNY